MDIPVANILPPMPFDHLYYYCTCGQCFGLDKKKLEMYRLLSFDFFLQQISERLDLRHVQDFK